MRFKPLSQRTSLALVALGLTSVTFGRASTFTADHSVIVDGIVAAKGDPLAKFTVRIFLPDGSCSGTLITQNIVLTAAHCVVADKTEKIFPHSEDIQVAFNRFESETLTVNSSLVLKASKVILDKGYLGANSTHTSAQDYTEFSRKNHDVALIRLERDAPADFAPIPLARADEVKTYADTATIAGYGQEAGPTGSRIGRLKSASVKITSNGSYYSKITTEAGNGLGCFGDSGGPLLIKTPAEGYKVAGVHNTGTTDCGGENGAARIADYTDFLDQAMARLGSSSANLFTAPASAGRGSSWPSLH